MIGAPPSAPLLHPSQNERLHAGTPALSQAFKSLLRTLVAVIFVLTFIVQPLLIPSESMERTLLVGDFLLFNKQAYAPAGRLDRLFLPSRPVARGDIVVFHHPDPPLLIKRVVGIPGDRLRIAGGQVFVNGAPLDEPYTAFEPAPPDLDRDNVPARIYIDPEIDPDWWRQMQNLTSNGALVVPPGEYFVLGDNRNHSKDSRYWGFVPRQAFVARPVVIYFSLTRPSSTDAQPSGQQAPNDKLGLEQEFAAKLTGFARWRRIFHVVH